jgi:Secretion system C-terminal sorting domain
MKKLLFTFLCICFIAKISASHLAGGIIRYQVINDTTRTYKIFLEITRECSGIPLGNTANVNVYCGTNCGTLLTSVTLNQDSVVIKSQVCDINQTTCLAGTLPGLETHYYSIVDTMPNCITNFYTFAWTDGARNSGVLNLQGGANFSVYSTHNFSYLPNTNYSINTAPLFLAPPAPFFYAGSTVCYSLSAIDTVDNDSLAYELVPCAGLNTAGACADILPYNSGYTFTQPFGTTITHTFDPITGVISFTPPVSAAGVYNFSIKVKEYRNGNLIGEYIRDLQCAIITGGTNISCNPAVAGNSGIVLNSTNNSVIAICDSLFNLNFNFPITSGNQFSLDSANSNIPSWLTFNIVASATNLSITLSGTVPCSSNVNSPITLNLIQTCGPGITLPAIATVSVGLRTSTIAALGLSNTIREINQLILSPNPAQQFIQIESPNNQKIKSIALFDMAGKLISEINDFKTSGINLIGTAHLKNSVYYIKVVSNKSTYYNKFIKE